MNANNRLIERSRELHKKLIEHKKKLTTRNVTELQRIDAKLAKQFESGSWLQGRPVKLGSKQHYFIEFDWAYSSDSGRFSSEADLTKAQADEIRTELEKRAQEEQDIMNIEVYVPAPYHQTYAELRAELKEAFGDGEFKAVENG